jgi:hypothetical protein
VCDPAETSVSVQLVTADGDEEDGQPLLGALPSRITKYVTEPLAGGVTVVQLSAAWPEPPVAVSTGAFSVPTLPVALPEPVALNQA